MYYKLDLKFFTFIYFQIMLICLIGITVSYINFYIKIYLYYRLF